MPESETDLVGGFHTEYGSFKFGIFFVAEYAHIVIGSAIFTVIFLGGWHFLPFMADPWPQTWVGTLLGVGWFLAKTIFLIFFFIWIRWTLPRFRYDQVMSLGWTKLLPSLWPIWYSTSCWLPGWINHLSPTPECIMAKTVVLERKPLSLSEKTYLPQIVTVLKTTFTAMFKPKVTLQYPEDKPNIPDNYRGVPTLVKDPNGREKCVSCQLCEFVCPPKRFGSPRVRYLKIRRNASMWRKHLENLKLICFAAFTVVIVRRFVRKKLSFYRISILCPVILARK